MNFAGTFEEAMREVAERLVFRKTASPANDAQSARQALGILGATPGTIDSAVSRLNKGELSPGSAISKIRGAVPGTFSQIGNLPHGILAALRQGRPGDAVAQADIAGVKNIVPFSEHFSPTTALAAGAAGYGASKLQGMAAHAQLLRNRLHGTGKADVEAMKSVLPAKSFKRWEAWRRSRKGLFKVAADWATFLNVLANVQNRARAPYLLPQRMSKKRGPLGPEFDHLLKHNLEIFQT